MSKPSRTLYRTTNWSSYTAVLRKRGSLLIWLDKDMTWLAPHDGSPPKFDSKSGNFASFNFPMPYFSMSYCLRASCFGETLL